MDRFLHQHNIHSDFYILNSQTNTQKQKKKTTKRGNEPKKKKEPKNNNNKELIPLNFSPI